MKKSTLSYGVIGGLSAVLAFSGIAVAAQILPRITRVCETKNGQIIAIGDGFSNIKNCPAGSRQTTIIGEKGDKGDKGDVGQKGENGATGAQGLRGETGPAGQGLDLTKIYSKLDGPFNINKGYASTVIHGCNEGDLAIGGGMEIYTGNLNNWQTIRSLPLMTETSDVTITSKTWATTVINNVESGTVFMLTRCIDLQ